MLEELHIQNLALIDDAWLEFAPGLTVLTGETGAGKTVLLSALKLLLGQRSDAQAIAPGANELNVEGRFFFEGAEEDEVVVTRSVSGNGRSKITCNGSMATAKTLQEMLGSHVDLHGQHDHQKLLKSSSHRAILDAYGKDQYASKLEAYVQAYKTFKEAQKTLDELRAASEQNNQMIEMNRLVLQEIVRVNPQENEDDRIREQLPSLEHAEEIVQAADEVWGIATGENGVADQLSHALSSLEHVLSYDRTFEDVYQRLNSLLIETQEIGAQMRDHAQGVDRDPRRLNDMQARLKDLESLAKRFGPRLEDVVKKRKEIEINLDMVDNLDVHIQEAQEASEAAKSQLEDAAEHLHDARVHVGENFCAELQSSLSELALDSARFEIECEPLPFEEWSQAGSDKIEILYSPAKQVACRPLVKIASGGEISRVMLAIKSLMGKKDETETLVFDEIDVGLGGAVAHSVGKRLHDLAQTHQVIVITHLAQVAVFADKHYVVKKDAALARTQTHGFTSVVGVEGDERVKEIARLLSGETTETAYKHAEELLDSALRA